MKVLSLRSLSSLQATLVCTPAECWWAFDQGFMAAGWFARVQVTETTPQCQRLK